MLRWALVLVSVFLLPPAFAEELKPGESRPLRMSLSDTFVVQASDRWTIDIDRELPLRFAEVYITPKQGTDWSLALRFLCDTPDLAKMDTPEKMRRLVERSAQRKTPRAVEKEIQAKPLDTQGRYGFCVTLTDAALSLQKEVPPGQFRYVTEGILRLSEDSALLFVLYTNDLDSASYREAIDYAKSFVKPAVSPATVPAVQ